MFPFKMILGGSDPVDRRPHFEKFCCYLSWPLWSKKSSYGTAVIGLLLSSKVTQVSPVLSTPLLY